MDSNSSSSEMHTIHPSVIMSISEHHTRTRDDTIVGALLGKKREIMDSFELCKKSDSELDTEYFHKKCSLIKQVSPDLDLIGWYSTDFNQILHDQICKLIQNPLFLKLEPDKRDGMIPLTIYESVDDNKNLEQASWTIVTEDVEIIGLDNAKMPHVSVAPSAAIDNLMLQRSAVKMLKDRIKVISKYVKDVQAQKLTYNKDTINDIAKLCKRFPLMNVDQYTQAYNVQCNDVALNTYLGILTKGSIGKMHFGVPNLKKRAYSSGHARK